MGCAGVMAAYARPQPRKGSSPFRAFEGLAGLESNDFGLDLHLFCVILKSRSQFL